MDFPKIDTIHQKPNQKPHEVVDGRFVTSDAQKKQEFNEKHGLKPPPIILHEILFSNTDHDVGGKYPDAGVYKDYPIGRPILNALAELGIEVKILACLADDQPCRK